ncbi:MAG: SGNH/GDSL hydrolase family protein [Kiritimatiellales bacterium]|nr:SGNH/GDSL hydrolase family protein [Kiritimatiellales bacterium]
MRIQRTWLMWLTIVVFVLVTIEILSSVTLLGLKHWKNITYDPALSYFVEKDSFTRFINGDHVIFKYHPELGWTANQNDNPFYGINEQGLRNNETISTEKSLHTLRIAAFGDSYTFGQEVSSDEAWATLLDNLLPDTEVLNFGVGGYGIDQAFLRYKIDGAQYDPDIVLIGYNIATSLRSANRYRPFMQNNLTVMTKPRFLLNAGELILLKNPIQTLEEYQNLIADPIGTIKYFCKHDYFCESKEPRIAYDFLPTMRLWYVIRNQLQSHKIDRKLTKNGVLNTENEIFTLSIAIIEEFVQEVLEDGAMPIVILFPTKDDVNREYNNVSVVYEPLKSALEKRGIQIIDLKNIFHEFASKHSYTELFMPYNHYTPEGNAIVAQKLADELQKILQKQN